MGVFLSLLGNSETDIKENVTKKSFLQRIKIIALSFRENFNDTFLMSILYAANVITGIASVNRNSLAM